MRWIGRESAHTLPCLSQCTPRSQPCCTSELFHKRMMCIMQAFSFWRSVPATDCTCSENEDDVQVSVSVSVQMDLTIIRVSTEHK